jgi:hypothetical protein
MVTRRSAVCRGGTAPSSVDSLSVSSDREALPHLKFYVGRSRPWWRLGCWCLWGWRLPVADQIAFGKLPKMSDSRTLLLSLSLSGGLLTGQREPAEDVSNDGLVSPEPWGELGNNQYRDCAIAAAGHAEMLWAKKYHQQLASPTVARILDDYSKITGFDRDDPATDKGSNLLSVLKFWQKTGIAGQKIGAYAEILPPDVETIRWAIDKLGLAYVGLQLPVTTAAPKSGARPSFTASKRWWDPATWQNPLYGHCVIYTGFHSDKTFTCVSWGQVMTVTEEFHKAYCDEAYAILAPEDVEGGAATANPAVGKLKGAALERRGIHVIAE